MSDPTYSVEYAKSARSKCKRCKEPIAKGDMRIQVNVPADESGAGYALSSNFHVGCFKLPRKFAKVDPADFCQEKLVDGSDDQSILPAKLEKIIALVQEANAAGPVKRKKGSSGDDTPKTFMDRVKAQALSEDEPPKKKSKANNDDEFEQFVELYKEHHKKKADNLKDYLRWNRQVLQGTKDFVLFKVLDGMIHGRLGNCPLDGGRLKYPEGEYDHVVCMGRFDEDNQVRLPCEFQGDRSDPKLRCKPFYLQEPSEEEKEEMDKLQEEARGESNPASSEAAEELLEAVRKCNWDLSNPKGIKNATTEMVELVKDKLDLPEGRDLKRLLGQIFVSNADKGAEGVAQEILDKYGFKEDKEAKQEAKQAALEAACENPKNGSLLMAFQELATLYFKGAFKIVDSSVKEALPLTLLSFAEGNRNAGSSYQKVVGVIKGMEMEITAENAMSLCKGKTKVPGIGMSSAAKMKEFLSTGTMEKLEEKRAANA
eukprot:Nitzschia sp. Nitz4//scaffold29_size155292//65550//67145//NITZ4_002656-RA/size155292-processed-gene-0.45-mRNA-1//-1//CDS//3329546442//3424//frame0